MNYGKLKLQLLCKGARIPEEILTTPGIRPVLRTRAGLGSGIDVILPNGSYVNIPVYEKFAQNSEFSIVKKGEKCFLNRNTSTLCGIKIPPRPKWYDKKTSSGVVMSRVAVMQGSYLAVYPKRVCAFWEMNPKQNCKFCSTGLNVGVHEEAEKKIDDVVETALSAKKESGITFVHFNTGYYEGGSIGEIMEYVKAVKKHTGLLVGVQCPPEKDFRKYADLKKAGANHLSFCFEFFDKEYFKEYCPGKDAFISQRRFLDAMEYCSKLFGKGKVSGEIIAGIEPVLDTLKAIEHITSIGAFPTVCVFRPLSGTQLEDKPSPKYEDMLEIFSHAYKMCRDNSIPTGIAPNIKVGIIINPDEFGYFAKNYGMQDILYGIRLFFLRVIFRFLFRIPMFFSPYHLACLICFLVF